MHELLYPLTLPGDPQQPREAATKQYVDNTAGSSTLDELSDVEITSPAPGDGLAYTGTGWVNAPLTGGSGGTGLSAATVTVAARDATPQQRDAADLVCPSTLDDDALIIQQAIDSIVTSGNSNFAVLLTQGTYQLKTPVNLKSGTSLQGMSRDSTIIQIHSAFSGPAVFRLADTNVHATELGNFRIDGNNYAGNKVNGIWFNNGVAGDYTGTPNTDPDAVHYIHDIYMRNISGNGIIFAGTQSPTILDGSFTRSDSRGSVVYNTIVRSPGEHCYWLHVPDSRFISMDGSSSGSSYPAGSQTNPRPNVVLMGGNSRMITSKVYSGNSHGFYVHADRPQFTNCEAQDTGDYGWVIRSRHGTYNNIVSDCVGKDTGEHSGTPINPNVAGMYIAGYNNMINGQVKFRNRPDEGWAPTKYQFFALDFDTKSYGSGSNVVEIHCQQTMTNHAEITSGLYTGTFRAEYARITTDQSGASPRFWFNDIETTLGAGSGGGWPRDVTYTSDPGVPEIKITNNYYDGSATQRDNIQIYTDGVKSSWLNEWGGLRLQPPDEGYGYDDAHIRLIRASDTAGTGRPIEFLNKARTSLLASMDWYGNINAPNVKHRLAVYGPQDTVEDLQQSAYVAETFSFAKWLGAGIANGTIIDRTVVGTGDTPFYETSTVNVPVFNAGFIDSSLPAGRTVNESSVTQRFEQQQSVVTRFNFNATQLPTSTAASILIGSVQPRQTNNIYKQFAIRLTTSGRLRILNDADVQVGSDTTAVLTDGTDYIINVKYRSAGATGTVSVTLCNTANTPIAGGYITATVPAITVGPLSETLTTVSAFTYGLPYYGTTAAALSNKVGNIYIQKGSASDTELVTNTSMAVELASKHYVDSVVEGVGAFAMARGGDSTTVNSADARFVIATKDAPANVRAAANLNLANYADNEQASILNQVFAQHTYFKIIGPTLQLDNSVVINNNVDIVSDDTTIIGHPTLNSTSVNRFAIFKVWGSETTMSTNPFNSTVTQGAKTLTFNTPHGFAEGDWLRIHSTELRNANRAMYTKGELNRVVKVLSSTSLELEIPTRESYATSGNTINIYKMNMLTNVRLEGLTFRCSNATTAGRQEMLVVQWAVNPVIKNVKVYGGTSKRAGTGIALGKCFGGLIENCLAEDILDWYPPGEAGMSGRNGYGFYVGGTENVTLVNCIARSCRHGYDVNNFGVSAYPVARYTIFDNCVAYQCTQPPFTTHDAHYATYTNCHAVGCGGGFQVRGEFITATDCKVIEPTKQYHIEWGTGGAVGSTTGSTVDMAGFIVGESDDGSNAQGTAGYKLNIKNFVVDAHSDFRLDGLLIHDPLKDAYIGANLLPSLRGLRFIGDFVENSTFNITLRGDYQQSTYNGMQFTPPATSSAPQYMSNSTINLHADNIRNTAIVINGGSNGGVSEHNTINLNVPRLGSGVTSMTPQVIYGAGSHGKQLINKIYAPNTFQDSSVSNLGGAVLTYGPLTSYKQVDND